MPNPYRYIQAFSIDIAIGGVIGALFIAKYLGVTVGFFILSELFLAIWIIYTFDHLIDSRSVEFELVTFRHKTHRRLSTTIWGVWSLSLVIAFSLLFKIPTETIFAGSLLSGLVLLYFVSLKILREGKVYHKEFSAAIIYATGIFIGPLSLYKSDFSPDMWILFIEFVVLAFINLLIFSMYEQVIDQKSGFHSLVKSIGLKKTRIITITLIILLALVATISMIYYQNDQNILEAQFIILIMDAILGLILLNRRTLIIKERFRVIADAVFFIPVAYILL